MLQFENILSFLIVIRNDNYTDNYINRLSYCLNFLCKNIKDLNLLKDIKIEIVDWGSKSKFADCLEITDEDFNKILNFYNVKESMSKSYDNMSTGDFFVEAACNVCFRRSKSKFILHYPADEILTKSSLYNLINFLNNLADENTFYLIQRKILDDFFYKKNFFEIEQLNYFLENENFLSTSFNSDRVYSGGGIGGILMQKKHLLKIGGYNENTLFRGRYGQSDNYSTKKLQNFFKYDDLTKRGVFFYKLPYSNKGKRTADLKIYRKIFKIKNYYQLDNNFNKSKFLKMIDEIKPNQLIIDKNEWGLAKENIELVQCDLKINKNLFIFDEKKFFERKISKINFFNLLKLIDTWFFYKSKKDTFFDFAFLFQLISKFNILSVIYINIQYPNLILSISKIFPHLKLLCSLKKDYTKFGDMWFYLASQMNRTHKGYFRLINEKVDLESLLKETIDQEFSNLIILDDDEDYSKFLAYFVNKKKNINFVFINKNVSLLDSFKENFFLIYKINNYYIFMNNLLDKKVLNSIEDKNYNGIIFYLYYYLLKLFNIFFLCKWKLYTFKKKFFYNFKKIFFK
jgi:hypothetical protein